MGTQETVNKTVHMRLLHLKYVLALPWGIWNDRLSSERCISYISTNNWIATNTTGSYCLKIEKCVARYIIFTLHARNVRFQRVPRSQTLTKWNDASKTSGQIWSKLLSSFPTIRVVIVDSEIISVHPTLQRRLSNSVYYLNVSVQMIGCGYHLVSRRDCVASLACRSMFPRWMFNDRDDQQTDGKQSNTVQSGEWEISSLLSVRIHVQYTCIVLSAACSRHQHQQQQCHQHDVSGYEGHFLI